MPKSKFLVFVKSTDPNDPAEFFYGPFKSYESAEKFVTKRAALHASYAQQGAYTYTISRLLSSKEGA